VEAVRIEYDRPTKAVTVVEVPIHVVRVRKGMVTLSMNGIEYKLLEGDTLTVDLKADLLV
jgi:hypothetical protein